MLETIKCKVVDELRDRIGQSYYLCDLGMVLSEDENANGSWYCSTFQAKEEVINNFDFCGSFVEFYHSNIGDLLNPFEDVKVFHCKMMIFAVENAFCYALNKTEYSDLWNDEFEITEEFVNEIESAIEDIIESDIF
jgi:hypothetical protein